MQNISIYEQVTLFKRQDSLRAPTSFPGLFPIRKSPGNEVVGAGSIGHCFQGFPFDLAFGKKKPWGRYWIQEL